jgi:hypothetical protein
LKYQKKFQWQSLRPLLLEKNLRKTLPLLESQKLQ